MKHPVEEKMYFFFLHRMPRPVMAAIISRVKRYLLLITFYLALWADINQNCDYKKNDTSHSELEYRSRQFSLRQFTQVCLDYKSSDKGFSHMLSGDISPNPGPGKKSCKPKYPCKECGKQVKSNQDAILCSSCGMWSHAKCLHMTKARAFNTIWINHISSGTV